MPSTIQKSHKAPSGEEFVSTVTVLGTTADFTTRFVPNSAFGFHEQVSAVIGAQCSGSLYYCNPVVSASGVYFSSYIVASDTAQTYITAIGK